MRRAGLEPTNLQSQCYSGSASATPRLRTDFLARIADLVKPPSRGQSFYGFVFRIGVTLALSLPSSRFGKCARIVSAT